MKCEGYMADEIREALRGKGGKDASRAVSEISQATGFSPATIWRVTRDVRVTSRQPRSDRGNKRLDVPGHVLDFMRGLVVQGDFSAENAIWITSRHFDLPEKFMSESTWNRWISRERISRSLNKKDLRAASRIEWGYANALHHYDTTVAEAYYINDDGSIGNEPGYERYKNKKGNRRPRLILYSLVDDYSRVIFA